MQYSATRYTIRVKLLDVLRAPWTWLTTIDPKPGITGPKMARLMVKAVLFAFIVVILQSTLVGLGVPFAKTIWLQLLLALAVYIPMARFLNAEFTPPVAGMANNSKNSAGKSGKSAKADKKVRYAGVKGKGPKFR